jgi:hypothetical protein
LLIKEEIGKVFKYHPAGRTKEDIFEQIINFIISDTYVVIKGIVELLVENGGNLFDVAKAA